MVSGVREIACEAAVRTRMTSSAGGNDILPTKMRLRIRHSQNVVCPMAVMTLRGFGRPEPGYFTVLRIEIAVRHV